MYCEECLTLRRQLDDKRGMALVLRLWGKVLLQQDDLKHAQELNRDCLSLFESLRDTWGMANSYENMAFVAHRLGEQREAQKLFSQSLSLYQTLGDRAAIASVIEGLARIACTRRDMVRATQLMGSAQALRDTIQAPMTTTDQADFERYINAARQQLGDKTFEAAHQRGRQRTLEDAVQYGLKL